jgi:predicted dehydrogenase
VTRDSEHFEINMAAIEAGKHVLSEKPVAHDFRDVRRAADLAAANGLKTKVGFTFRYSPAVRYIKHLIDSGSLGTPFIYNAYEQNSQWLNPATPLRGREGQGGRGSSAGPIQVASLEGYGAPVIDIGHWFMGSDLTAVVGVMRNFIPERMLASTGAMARVNIDDGDIFIGEFASGAICSVQSSFVTVGNYPGIEVRVYGSEGAAIARLIEESGICETLKIARPDDVEFRELTVPQSFYPAGGSPTESWRTLYYANLTANFASEVLGEVPGNEGNFADGLWVQEVINAVEISHHERRWVSLPLANGAGS